MPRKRQGTEKKGIVLAKAARKPRSFRAFVRKHEPNNPPINALRPYASADDFPSGGTWQEIRLHLLHAGAEHEAIVGARIAWREYHSQ